MARPSKDIKRTTKITVTLTVLEHLLLVELSKKSGVQKSVICRRLIADYLNQRKTSFKVVPAEVKECKYQLYRIGANLNQIAKQIHTDRQVTLTTQMNFNNRINEAIEVLKQIEKQLQ